MKASVLKIHWHEQQPIYSVSLGKEGMLATSGGDNHVRIWKIEHGVEPGAVMSISYVCTLKKHRRAVNAVRFSQDGTEIASGGDGGQFIVWKPGDKKCLSTSDDGEVELWIPAVRGDFGDKDIYDIQWMSDSRRVVMGLTDNTCLIFDVYAEKCISVLNDHTHFVQGVCVDPRNEFLVTQSRDRSVKIYKHASHSKGRFSVKCIKTLCKIPSENGKDIVFKKAYHDETLLSFFRKPDFTPDGSILIVPTGIYDGETYGIKHYVYIYTRPSICSKKLNPLPVLCIGPFSKPAIMIKSHPKLFRRRHTSEGIFNLPYRMVFAVSTSDGVFLYDTESRTPFFGMKNFHYEIVTDLSWSREGLILIMSSADGFCSMVSFETNDLGELYTEPHWG